jgi:hypothetical protein
MASLPRVIPASLPKVNVVSFLQFADCSAVWAKVLLANTAATISPVIVLIEVVARRRAVID